MAPPQLPTRKLGKNGPEVTALGFGAMGLSAFYGAPESDEERFKVLDRAYELGERNWDSADVYMDNEDLIGKWFKRTGKRDEIFLATKFSNHFVDGQMVQRSDPEYVRRACEKSLQRLGIPTIDLYYCHRLDGKTPIEKTVEAMAQLKKYAHSLSTIAHLLLPILIRHREGKIRYLGLSEVSSNSLRRACKVHHIDAVQIEYSPFTLDIESPEIALLKTCRELGVATVAYSPLGRGMLTGAYKSPADFEEGDFRKYAPRFSEENFPKNLKLADEIGAIAKKKGCTAGQLTLAWLLAQGDDIIPIPGTKKIKYLEENMKALEIKLTKEEEKEIRKAVEGAEVHGLRYPEGMAGKLFAESPEL
jgi:aryl-alcohol dehydrogenase-like predicted oxidoreductase